MGMAVFSFLVIFLLIVSGGLLLFFRQPTVQRISSVVTSRPGMSALAGTPRSRAFSISQIVQQLERVVPKSQAELSVVRQRLVRAGYRRDSDLKAFYGAKALCPVALCIFAAASGAVGFSPFFAYAMALGLGFLLPDFWLGRRIARRQHRIRLGLPEVLDFLIICVEAGLSLDQATARTAAELRISQPELSGELDIIVLEQRAGLARSDAWKKFAERTDIDSATRLVSVLVQSEQLGTSIAKTLRVHSDTLRVQRRQQVEEQAAKTTVKLVFPLVLFIFPSLFLVTLGPAAIVMAEAFEKYFSH
jgi:tight adherence protein C